MQCPHCQIAFHELEADEDEYVGDYADGFFSVVYNCCPSCNKLIVQLFRGEPVRSEDASNYDEIERVTRDVVIQLYPKTSPRSPCPAEVPIAIAEDYTESCNVLSISPKASAALSRRCLQQVLEAQGAKSNDLAKQIDSIASTSGMASSITDMLHSVREIGNFAAHPRKHTASGEIMSVEPEEAELNLEVLEALFDHFYVAPAKNQKRKDALNAKLTAAGKKPV